MGFGIIVIGDEILCGKRQDKHLAQSIDLLSERNLDLAWASFIGDDANQITQTLCRTYASEDIVFCFGGIGATPDDLTRPCAAKAAGVELIRHPDAVREIEAQFGQAAYPNRILMADMPAGARIIPNFYNRVPGFSLHNHHFLPGFPEMAKFMMEHVLDKEYVHLQAVPARDEQIVRAYEAHESELLNVMNEIVATFRHVRFSSLPHLATPRRYIDLGFKGEPGEVRDAVAVMLRELKQRAVEWERIK